MGARVSPVRVYAKEKRVRLGKCKNAIVLPRTNTLCVIFAPFPFAQDGHTSLAPHPPEKRPSVCAGVFCYGRVGFTQTISLSSQSFFLSVCEHSLHYSRGGVASVCHTRPRRCVPQAGRCKSILPRPHFAAHPLTRRTLLTCALRPAAERCRARRQSPESPPHHETRRCLI